MYTVRITYEDKHSLKRHTVTFKYALDAKHITKIAKKLRPKRHRIVSVDAFQVSNPNEDDSLPEHWPSDLT